MSHCHANRLNMMWHYNHKINTLSPKGYTNHRLQKNAITFEDDIPAECIVKYSPSWVQKELSNFLKFRLNEYKLCTYNKYTDVFNLLISSLNGIADKLHCSILWPSDTMVVFGFTFFLLLFFCSHWFVGLFVPFYEQSNNYNSSATKSMNR